MKVIHKYPSAKKGSAYSIPVGVTEIGRNVFSGDLFLETVVIPDTVTSIKGSAFYSTNGIKSITIPKSVEHIEGYAFHNVGKETTIYIEGRTAAPEEWKYWDKDCEAKIVWNP